MSPKYWIGRNESECRMSGLRIRPVEFVEAIVFAPCGLFVMDRSRNHPVARADGPKSLNDCVHPMPKMLLWTAKALIFPMGGSMRMPNSFHRAKATKKKEVRVYCPFVECRCSGVGARHNDWECSAGQPKLQDRKRACSLDAGAWRNLGWRGVV